MPSKYLLRGFNRASKFPWIPPGSALEQGTVCIVSSEDRKQDPQGLCIERLKTPDPIVVTLEAERARL